MLIIGLPGKTVTRDDREWLAHPQVSGVILFTRNFESREQVTALIDDLRTERPDPFLVCVDQEGGPVQRFRPGFTRLPALARIGEAYSREPAAAIALAEEHAWLMASEMRAIGVDAPRGHGRDDQAFPGTRQRRRRHALRRRDRSALTR
jgi:beta-N-acetylhexosaminidase